MDILNPKIFIPDAWTHQLVNSFVHVVVLYSCDDGKLTFLFHPMMESRTIHQNRWKEVVDRLYQRIETRIFPLRFCHYWKRFNHVPFVFVFKICHYLNGLSLRDETGDNGLSHPDSDCMTIDGSCNWASGSVSTTIGSGINEPLSVSNNSVLM